VETPEFDACEGKPGGAGFSFGVRRAECQDRGGFDGPVWPEGLKSSGAWGLAGRDTGGAGARGESGLAEWDRDGLGGHGAECRGG